MIKRIRMKKLVPFLTLIPALVFFSFIRNTNSSPSLIDHSLPDTLLFPDETHLANVQQLTFGGDNAEAYWSFDGKYIVFQRTNPKEGLKCDQIFYGKVPEKRGDKFEYKMISSGKGRCTCSFITKDGKHIIYASTHLGADTCPPFPMEANMETNIFGRCMTVMIFSWPILTERSSGNLLIQKATMRKAPCLPMGKR